MNTHLNFISIILLIHVDYSLLTTLLDSDENPNRDSEEENDSHKNNEWSYEGHQGPSYWPELDPLCHGLRQSPINILTNETLPDNKLKGITFEGYDVIPSVGTVNLVNNGHTIKMEFTEDLNMTIFDSDFKSKYKFSQLHFHWGEFGSHGSEHNINGKSFAMEIHLVHYLDHFKSLSDAANKNDGLAVIGILIEVGSTIHPGLDNIVKDLHRVMYKKESVPLRQTFPLDSLLPSNTQHYYRYHGSLTTPTCYETVIWTVLDEPIKISHLQLAEFLEIRENILGKQPKPLQNNYRPPQPINSRTIFHSMNAASKYIPTRHLVIMSFCIALNSILG